jgi:predicted transcriptional regulator YdeE
MILLTDVAVTQEESDAYKKAESLGVEMHTIEHNRIRFYIVFDEQPEPAIYSSLERLIADNFGQ